jgi:hypothetical protein
MLGKFLKGCLAVAMVASMATAAMAEMTTYGVVAVGLGMQASPSMSMAPTDYDKKAKLALPHYGEWGFTVAADKWKASAGWGSGDYSGEDTTSAVTIDPFAVNVQYLASDALTIKLGSHSAFNMAYGSTGFCGGGGSWSYLFPSGVYGGNTAAVGGYGIHAYYKLTDDIKVAGGYIIHKDAVASSFFGTNKGTTVHLAVNGNAGDIKYRFAYASGTTDDPSIETDNPYSSSGMNLSAGYSGIDIVTINFEYQTKSKGTAVAGGEATPSTNIALQGVLADLGPGTLAITYGMKSGYMMFSPSTGVASSTTNINLNYRLNMEALAGASVELVYAQGSFVGDYATGGTAPEALTDSFMGVLIDVAQW